MDELAKAFKNFLYRDLFYVLSGLMMLICARTLGMPNLADFLPDDTARLVFVIGCAYALALANQEAWSQTPIIKTHHLPSYNCWLLGIYRRHTRTEWAQGDDLNRKAVCEDADYLRAINMKQLGASVGTSLLTCSILLAIAAARGTDGAAKAAGLALALSIVFIHVAWLHNMRQTAFRAKTDDPPAAA